MFAFKQGEDSAGGTPSHLDVSQPHTLARDVDRPRKPANKA